MKREKWCRSCVCLRDKVAASATKSRALMRQNLTCDNGLISECR